MTGSLVVLDAAPAAISVATRASTTTTCSPVAAPALHVRCPRTASRAAARMRGDAASTVLLDITDAEVIVRSKARPVAGPDVWFVRWSMAESPPVMAACAGLSARRADFAAPPDAAGRTICGPADRRAAVSFDCRLVSSSPGAETIRPARWGWDTSSTSRSQLQLPHGVRSFP